MLHRNRSHKKQQDNDKIEEKDMSSSSSSSSSPSTDSSIASEKEKELERRRKMQEEPVSLGVQQEPTGPTTPTTTGNATINTTAQSGSPARPTVAEATAPAEVSTTTTATTTAEGQQRDKSVFENRIDQEFNNAMEEEIKKGVQAIYRRFNMMLAQERTPKDHAKDALGHETDFYENLVNAVQSGDPSAGKTTEEVYLNLYNLAFTGMRSLDALKQEFSITSSS